MEKHVEKIWGSEDWIINGDYCGKKLNLKKGFQCSIHYHTRKDEHFYIMSGAVLFEKHLNLFLKRKNELKILEKGDDVHINRFEPHRFIGIEDSEIIEFSTHHEDSDSTRLTMSGPCRGDKAVFIDRDGTIVEDGPYNADPDKVKLFDDVGASIKKLNDADFLVIMVTNQSGIGRGYFTETQMNRVNKRIKNEIRKSGGCIDAIYHCPHTPEEKCYCRKPNPGMILQAYYDYGINLFDSYMIGDTTSDVLTAIKCGLKPFYVKDISFVESVEAILNES